MRTFYIIQGVLMFFAYTLSILFIENIYINIGGCIFLLLYMFCVILPLLGFGRFGRSAALTDSLFAKRYLLEIGIQLFLSIVFALLGHFLSFCYLPLGFHLMWFFSLLIEVVGRFVYNRKNDEQKEDNV